MVGRLWPTGIQRDQTPPFLALKTRHGETLTLEFCMALYKDYPKSVLPNVMRLSLSGSAWINCSSPAGLRFPPQGASAAPPSYRLGFPYFCFHHFVCMPLHSMGTIPALSI